LCGSGTQTRTITVQPVNAPACPALSQACNTQACPVVFGFTTASASGDPHTDTYDGFHHDVMVSGWFTWAKNSVVNMQAYTQLGCMPASIPNTCIRAVVVQITPPGTSDRLIVSWGSWSPLGAAGNQNVVISDSTDSSKNVNTPAGQFHGGTFLGGRYSVTFNGNINIKPVGAAVGDPNLAVSAAWGPYYISITLPKIAPHLGATNGMFGSFTGQRNIANSFSNANGASAGVTVAHLCNNCGWQQRQTKPLLNWAATHVVGSAGNAPIDFASKPALAQTKNLNGWGLLETGVDIYAEVEHNAEFMFFPRANKPMVFKTVVPVVDNKKRTFCTKLLKPLKLKKGAYKKQYESCLMDSASPTVARTIATVIKVARAQKKSAKRALKRHVVKVARAAAARNARRTANRDRVQALEARIHVLEKKVDSETAQSHLSEGYRQRLASLIKHFGAFMAKLKKIDA